MYIYPVCDCSGVLIIVSTSTVIDCFYLYLQGGQDQGALRALGGLNSLCRLLHVLDNTTPDLPPVIPIK